MRRETDRWKTTFREWISPVLLTLCLLLLLGGCAEPEKNEDGKGGGESSGNKEGGGGGKDGLVHEVRSEYSHIRIRDRGRIRTLLFVRDTGQEVTETSMDLDAPHRLQVPYTRYMFLSYLFRPVQESCLIVGLGGGAMVRFLGHHYPDLGVDAVEIDPVVVKIAGDFFETRPGPKTRLFTEDGFKYLERAKERYDVIYMDAFLKPSADTDLTGVPLHLKTIAFFKSLHEKLKEGGMVVFNLNLHPGMTRDIDAIGKAFPQVYVFLVPERRNRVIVGSLEKKRLSPSALEKAGRKMDECGKDFGFSFLEMVKKLQK